MNYKKIYLTKYQKELDRLNIKAPAKLFLDNAFYFYLEYQLNKAELFKIEK